MSDFDHVTWLTIPDVADRLDLKLSQVRRLIEERAFLAARIDGVLQVPEVFFRENEPLSELRGTLVVLTDAGFSDDEALHWLLTPEESLGVSPIDALLAGRKAEVRRVAQALGF